MTLVDTNVLLDLATDDPVWANWSQQALEQASMRGPVLINDVVYAELSAGYARMEELDAELDAARVSLAPMPKAALFLAGTAFVLHRRRSGRRGSALPDFFIGAHAAVAGVPLLTRDVARYRTYFPTVRLIEPTGGA